MAQFKATYDMLTTADSGPRDPRACLWGVFHTTEDPEGKDPRDTARWQMDPANESSYNVLFGADGTTVRSNDDDFCPWSVGMPGNRLGIHASAVGKAARTRAEWLARPKQIEALAQWAANLHIEYGIPLRWLTIAEVKSQSVRGFTSHATYWRAIAKDQKMDIRTDPGDGFPHDVVLNRAAAIAQKVEVKDMQASTEQDLILDQLCGFPWREFPGWPQLGGRTLVDAVAAIGEKLEIEGFKSP